METDKKVKLSSQDLFGYTYLFTDLLRLPAMLGLSINDFNEVMKITGKLGLFISGTAGVAFGLASNEEGQVTKNITSAAVGWTVGEVAMALGMWGARVGVAVATGTVVVASAPISTPTAMLWGQTLDRRELEFSGSDHDDWLVAPPGLCRAIGTLYPIAE